MRSDRRAEFERLYRQHRAGIIRYLIRQGADPDEVEDIAQTAFLHAFRAYAAGTRPEEPRRWLYAVARNTNRRRFRPLAARFRHVALDPELPAAEEDPLLARELARALAELPAMQRAALVQRELLGLEYEEIARRLDVTVGSVQMLLFRARKALRGRRFGLVLGAPLQAAARVVEGAWSWLQRTGPAEGAAGALAVAVAGAAVVASAPARPAPRTGARTTRVPAVPTEVARSRPAAPTRPAPRAPVAPRPPAAPPAEAAPTAAAPARPAARPAPPIPPPQPAVERPKPAHSTPAPAATTTAPAPPPTTTVERATAETAASPLQATVPVPPLDAAAPPEPPASVTVPVSTPPLRAPTVTTPLPVPAAPTPTVTNGSLP